MNDIRVYEKAGIIPPQDGWANEPNSLDLLPIMDVLEMNAQEKLLISEEDDLREIVDYLQVTSKDKTKVVEELLKLKHKLGIPTRSYREHILSYVKNMKLSEMYKKIAQG